MTYKSILTVLNDSRHLPGVVSVATDLARRFDAHLVGLHAVYSATESHELQDPWLVARIEKYVAKLDEQANRCETSFKQLTQSELGTKAEFRRAEQESLAAITVQARYADLVVIGQRDPEEVATGLPTSIVERCVLGTGRPVLVVPYFSHSFPKLGRNVLLAWNGTRESVRAVRDALPFLCAAENVVIMAVNPSTARTGHGAIPGADLALYLARHGVKAEVKPEIASSISVGDELLARASDLGSDLLVMGAYGHSRLQELVMGGVTQSMMQQMTLPALMSH